MSETNTYRTVNSDAFQQIMAEVQRASPCGGICVPVAIELDLSGSCYQTLSAAKKALFDALMKMSDFRSKTEFFVLIFVVYKGTSQLIFADFADALVETGMHALLRSLNDCWGPSPLAEALVTADKYLDIAELALEANGSTVGVPIHFFFSNDFSDNQSFNKNEGKIKEAIKSLNERVSLNERILVEVQLPGGSAVKSFGGIPVSGSAIHEIVNAMSVASSSVNVIQSDSENDEAFKASVREQLCDQLFAILKRIL